MQALDAVKYNVKGPWNQSGLSLSTATLNCICLARVCHAIRKHKSILALKEVMN